jgi:hypothetical protein
MIRRRQVPIFHQYSRLLIGAIAILGIFTTAYITWAKIDRNKACGTKDCETALMWSIKTTSSVAEIQLAEHLTKQGTKIYVSYWSPHSYEQKQLFGKQAWAKITYIECAEDAIDNPQPKVCQQANIHGFPTWIIDGKAKPGVKKLAELAKMTNYQGNTSFKYDRLLDKR